jgi:RHS repeat-associated protein
MPISAFGCDQAGQQIWVKDARQNILHYEYDEAGRRKKIIYPDQTTVVTDYDDVGRMIWKTDQAGKKTDYEYDKIGRLKTVTQYLDLGTTPVVTRYGYDELGNRTSQIDANQHTTKYDYDQLGRRIGRTLPLQMSESYTYDAAGNLKTRTDFNGRTTTYAYDNVNRLLSKTPDAYFLEKGLGASQVSYTYTASGKRQTMTDASGTTTYEYDQLSDQLTSKQTPFGTLSYQYDPLGNVHSIASSNTNGATMAYTYDKLNRLATVTVPGMAPTIYSYDDVGNLAGYTYPNGVMTSYTYDNLNRLTGLSSAGGSGALAQYTYVLGKAGNRLSVAELSGRTVVYGYDDLYRLKTETVSPAIGGTFTCGDKNELCGEIGYKYDLVGNRQQRTSTMAKIPATGLLNYDENDRTSTDVYDPNGNTVSSAGIDNAYDFENHLVKHGDVTVVYDGDGNRVAETVGGVTTRYLVDTENPTGYGQVIDELRVTDEFPTGKVARTYTWGLSLIAQNLRSGPEDAPVWQLSYYGFDGHGSVRFLADSTGRITDTYDYDAFGNVISQTGTTPNNYLFAGEQYDSALGLYYNRARYLDVRTGRFWGIDTCPGCLVDPSSLHQYLYTHSDPVDFVDPSGNFEASILGVTISLSVSDILKSAQSRAEQVLGQKAKRVVVCEAGKFVVDQALVAGVYIIVTELGGSLLPYIGSTGDIAQRIADHVRTGKMFEQVFVWFEVAGGLELRRIVEQKVINALTQGGLAAGVRRLPDAERIIANLRNEIRLDKFVSLCK